MEKSYKELLPSIKTIVLDFDGVFTNGTIQIHGDGTFTRTANVKDSYAIQYAAKKGFRVAVLSGGSLEALAPVLSNLGVDEVMYKSHRKKEKLVAYMDKHQLKSEEILYMGDDIPDLEVLQMVGVAACPSDAVQEVKAVCHYVSHKGGGAGCVRDVIEQVMKVQEKWLDQDAFVW